MRLQAPREKRYGETQLCLTVPNRSVIEFEIELGKIRVDWFVSHYDIESKDVYVWCLVGGEADAVQDLHQRVKV